MEDHEKKEIVIRRPGDALEEELGSILGGAFLGGIAGVGADVFNAVFHISRDASNLEEFVLSTFLGIGLFLYVNRNENEDGLLLSSLYCGLASGTSYSVYEAAINLIF